MSDQKKIDRYKKELQKKLKEIQPKKKKARKEFVSDPARDTEGRMITHPDRKRRRGLPVKKFISMQC